LGNACRPLIAAPGWHTSWHSARRALAAKSPAKRWEGVLGAASSEERAGLDVDVK